MSTKGKRTRTTNKRAKRAKNLKGLIPLSGDEVLKLILAKRDEGAAKAAEGEDKQMQLPAIVHQPDKRVTVMEDHGLKIPELWLNVYIHGPETGPNFYKMFARAKCFKANLPDEADLVVFTGSSYDIDPQLYGQVAHKSVMVNPGIDRENFKLYHFCKSRGIPMFGVCGGAQVLHVANGGTLYQDVDGHNGFHSMWDMVEHTMVQKISSIHHQMCVKNDRMEVLGISHASKERWLTPTECEKGTHQDVEAFYYRRTCCLGVQGHPEYGGYSNYTVWCLKHIDKQCNQNPDLSYQNSRLRIKPEILAERNKSNVITIPSEDVTIVEKQECVVS